MKITPDIQARRKKTLNHLRRIQGQIQTLERYITHDACCSDIAQLTTSIAKSFDSLRVKTLESFVYNILLPGHHVHPKILEQLNTLLQLQKK